MQYFKWSYKSIDYQSGMRSGIVIASRRHIYPLHRKSTFRFTWTTNEAGCCPWEPYLILPPSHPSASLPLWTSTPSPCSRRRVFLSDGHGGIGFDVVWEQTWFIGPEDPANAVLNTSYNGDKVNTRASNLIKFTSSGESWHIKHQQKKIVHK